MLLSHGVQLSEELHEIVGLFGLNFVEEMVVNELPLVLKRLRVATDFTPPNGPLLATLHPLN